MVLRSVSIYLRLSTFFSEYLSILYHVVCSHRYFCLFQSISKSSSQRVSERVSVYLAVLFRCCTLADRLLMCVFLSLQDLFEPAVPPSRLLQACHSSEWRTSFCTFIPFASLRSFFLWIFGVSWLPPSGFCGLGWVRLMRLDGAVRGLFFWLLVGGFSCLWEELICCWF